MYCLYIQVVLLVMLLSAQDLFTCLAHIIYIYIAYIFRSWEVWSCSCRRRTDLHVLQILNIYIYICIAYIFRWCFWSCFCRRRTYLHVLHILYIYIYIAYIFRWSFWSCYCRRRTYLHVLHILYIYIYIACIFRWCFWSCYCRRRTYLHVLHILYIYIYTLLVYSGDASGHASVGAGLIYMSCTYYIYIYCLYIQVMLLVLLLSAQDLFTCLANLPHLYQWSKFTRTKIYTRARPGAYGTQVSCRLEVMWAKICLCLGCRFTKWHLSSYDVQFSHSWQLLSRSSLHIVFCKTVRSWQVGAGPPGAPLLRMGHPSHFERPAHWRPKKPEGHSITFNTVYILC